MRNRCLLRAGCIISIVSLLNTMATAQSQPSTQLREDTYIYYFDELDDTTPPLPLGLVALRTRESDQNSPLAACRAGESQSAAVVAAIAVGLFKIFGSVLDASARRREQQALQRMSRSSAGLRTDSTFPVRPNASGDAFRCLIIDRVVETAQGDFEPRALYVLGLRQVSGATTAFTIEPLGARIDYSPLFRRSRDKVNATVSVTFQSVVGAVGNSEISTLPAFSASFENLTRGTNWQRPEAPSRRSPVMPIFAANVPTSVAAAVTEADVRLASEQQRIALEQANRTLLLTALGDILKAGITD